MIGFVGLEPRRHTVAQVHVGFAVHRGIRIANIYPGEVNTPILDERPNPVSDEHKAAILQPDDIGPLVVAIASLPAHAHVPEIVIKPLKQEYA